MSTHPNIDPDRPSKRLYVFLGLLTFHTALLISANAAGSKMIAIPGNLSASATVVAYIFSLLVLNCTGEIFGRRMGRLVIWLGLGAMLTSVLFFELALAMPAASYWTDQDAFHKVLGSTPRILLGGWTAYLFGQNLDLLIFLGLKKTGIGEDRVWLRTWLASAVSQLVDSAVFMTIAFWGQFPLIQAIFGQYAVKMSVTTIAAPLVYLAVRALRRYLSTKAYD
jgi:uncharacterized integral membrane protein (TIGR00697 family)